MSSRKVLYILIAVAVVAVAAMVIVTLVSPKTTGPVDNNTPDKNAENSGIKKVVVPDSQLPARFPTDIPLEKNAPITQNYNSTAPDGQFQASRVFTSSQPLATSFKIYTDYFKKAGYKVGATLDQPTNKFITGTKGNASLQVTVQEANGQKTVTISYTEFTNATK